MRRGPSDGNAALELIGIMPVVLGIAVLVLQVGAIGYGASATQEAARVAARADSLGMDPAAAARAALPSGYDLVSTTRTGASAHAVQIVVRVPRVSPLPAFELTREAAMP